ncbi:MAG: hypothetical protein K6C94_07180 [Candidatus Gastranaerophilales bacterium]|nr:hypothetical protein [Candidatus Gastranaerophilales bacterium]
MKKRICGLLIIFLMLTFGVILKVGSSDKMSPAVKNLIKSAQSNKTEKAITTYKNLNDEQIKEFYEYLEKNPGKLPPVYFVMVADKVYENDKDKAVFFYNFGKARAREDVMMCQDTTARQQLMMYGWIAPQTVQYMQTKSSDTQYIDNLALKIIEWDNRYNNRVSPIWACYHGISAFSEKPQLLPKEEFAKIQKQTHEDLKNMSKSIQEYKKKSKTK